MKTILFCLSLILSVLLNAETRHQYTLPNNSDEVGSLFISSSSKRLQLSNLPEIPDLIWGAPSSSTQSSFINGRSSSSSMVRLRFKATKPGIYIIPEFYISGHKIPEIKFEVKKSPYDTLYFLKTKILNDTIYPGQYFRLQADVYLHSDYAISGGDFTFPQLEVEGLKMHVFPGRKRNLENVENATQISKVINDENFNVIRISYLASAVINGKYNVQLNHNISVVKRNATPGTSRQVTLQRKIDFPEIKVKALPPAPKDVINTSLVGDWKLETNLDKSEVKVGLPFTLDFTFNSKEADPERLSLDELQFPKFRKLSEDRKIESRDISKVSARKSFILSSLGSDVSLPKFRFATFDPKQEKYIIHQAQLPAINFIGEKYQEPKKLQPRKQEKNSENSPVEFNTGKKAQALSIAGIHPIIFIFATLTPLALILKFYTQSRLSPEQMRRKKLKKIRKLLKKANTQKSQLIYKDHLMPLLSEIQKISASSGNTEIINSLSDEELKNYLKDFENSRFRPQAGELSGKKLNKLLKSLSLLFLFSFLNFNIEAQDQELKNSDFYIEQINKMPESLDLYLNAAHALRQEKRFNLAYAYTMRLLLMSPRLEQARELELLLHQDLKIKTLPKHYWMRPKDYLMISISLWIFLCLSLCVFRKPPRFLIVSISALTIIFLAYALYLNQTRWVKNSYITLEKAQQFSYVNSENSIGELTPLIILNSSSESAQRIQFKEGNKKFWISRKQLFKIW